MICIKTAFPPFEDFKKSALLSQQSVADEISLAQILLQLFQLKEWSTLGIASVD